MMKKIRFEFCDILSLEPVDASFRPLRLSTSLWFPLDDRVTKNKADEAYKMKVEYQNQLIRKMLDKIKFLKIH